MTKTRQDNVEVADAGTTVPLCPDLNYPFQKYNINTTNQPYIIYASAPYLLFKNRISQTTCIRCVAQATVNIENRNRKSRKNGTIQWSLFNNNKE